MPTIKASIRTQTHIERTHTIHISRSTLLAVLQEAGVIETVPDSVKVYTKIPYSGAYSSSEVISVADRPDEQIVIEWTTEDYEDSEPLAPPDPTPDSFPAEDLPPCSICGLPDEQCECSNLGLEAAAHATPPLRPSPDLTPLTIRTRSGTSRKPKAQ